MKTSAVDFFNAVQATFYFLQKPELNYYIVQKDQMDASYTVLYESKERLVLVIYDLKEEILSINIIRRDDAGFWANTNDWKNSVSLNNLYYRINHKALLDRYQPSQIGLKQSLIIQADMLQVFAIEILKGNEWISKEDILGAPKKIKTVKVYYK